jgi:RecG-like helicase
LVPPKKGAGLVEAKMLSLVVQDLVHVGRAALPFELTGAQKRVLAEVLRDMTLPVPMLRLLQGDVGSGKTAVAFLAALAAIKSGHQVAIMVPNGVLAEQHLRLMSEASSRMPPETRPRIETVTGSMTARCVALGQIRNVFPSPSLWSVHICV